MSGLVDISGKEIVERRAVATGRIKLTPATIMSIRERTVCKGEVLETARVAGLQAVKATPQIIPYCHPVPLESIKLNFDLDESGVVCECQVKAHYKTGLEMEALTGVSAALLTIWDMVKYLEKDEEGQYPYTKIESIQVSRKEKGEEHGV